jgi:hypothetical protein
MGRLLLLFSALCLVVATTGCSGDDDKDQDPDKGGKDTSVDGSATPDPDDELRTKPKTTTCDAEVSTTGTYEATWNGDASVRTGGKAIDESGPDAIYTLTDDRNQVALYSPGPDFKGSISMAADGASYSSDPADAESFDIDKRGKHAQVDTSLTSISGEELHLVAEFTCGKRKSK